jgi:Predicted membrane protein (DUF2142)
MRSAKVALAVGLSSLASALGVVLAQSPLSTLASNDATIDAPLISGKADVSFCQAGERPPRGTVAVRLALASSLGPRIALELRDGERLVASGARPSGWVGQTVTVPLRSATRALAPVTLCVTIPPLGEDVGLFGRATAAGLAARSIGPITTGAALPGRVGVEYLGPGRSSWLELASSVAANMSRGRAWSGIWVVFLVVASMLIVAALTAWLALRELSRSARRRLPRVKGLRWISSAACISAVVAALNAASWAFITPPFQVPDEPSHIAYVKQLAETGSLPTSPSDEFSPEEEYAMSQLRSASIRLDPSRRAIFSPSQQDTLDAGLEAFARAHPGEGSPNAGVATYEPPLYYALEAIPYRLASAGTLLDRIQLMRLLSALMGAATALFTFLFLRELLPRVRWAWTVGALGVALSPLFGFTSGGTNPDAMLIAVSAALFYCLARSFRRGLTMRSAIATGLVIAIGFLTKLNFAGLAPGAFLALAVIAVRALRRASTDRASDARHSLARRARALGPPATAALIGCLPVLAYTARNLALHRPVFGLFSDEASAVTGSLSAEANYIWQLYLPRLPGTANDFPGLFTTRQIWFVGYVGRLGWLDTFFPGWVYTLALVAAGALAALCARALLVRRAALRRRLSELAAYALMALGLVLEVGAASYGEFPHQLAEYGQARYLLALLPLLGAVLAVAARGAGRRWGPAVGALIVVLLLAHDVFSQLQVVARYYG